MSTSFSSFEPKHDPRRLLAIGAVAVVHVGLIYGLLQWGVRPEVLSKRAPVQVALIAERAESTALKPPPQPKFVTPDVAIEPPVLDLPLITDPPPTITVVYRPEAASAPPTSVRNPKMVSTVEYLRPLKLNYPPTSRKLREEGLVVLLVLVNEQGRPSRIEIRDSSGFKRLDRAAQDAVECARFKPYLENGVAQPALVLIPVEFTLNQRVAQR